LTTHPNKTVKGRGGAGYKDRSIMDFGNYTVKEVRITSAFDRHFTAQIGVTNLI
jgi:hypothetical protein